MIAINVVVRLRDQSKNQVEKKINWPVVPRKGEGLDLAPKGYTGLFAEVESVRHWFGVGDIDVICHLDDEKEWDQLAEMGWSGH